jgi:hypothetical protein
LARSTESQREKHVDPVESFELPDYEPAEDVSGRVVVVQEVGPVLTVEKAGKSMRVMTLILEDDSILGVVFPPEIGLDLIVKAD